MKPFRRQAGGIRGLAPVTSPGQAEPLQAEVLESTVVDEALFRRELAAKRHAARVEADLHEVAERVERIKQLFAELAAPPEPVKSKKR